MRAPRFALAFAVVVWPALASAKPGAGTLADPVRVDAMPYAIRGDTSLSSSSEIDAYDCSPATDESGPEIVYRFELPAPARVTAWVEGDTAVVDIDVQLLDGLDISGGYATGCVARNNRIAEANMGAGVHYVVVDSYQGAAQAGPFVLRLDAIGDAWNERQIAEGVVWRARRYQNQAGGPQVVHGLRVDTSQPGVQIVALQASGCQTIGAMATAAGAVAAINGGYFDPNGCAPVSLLVSKGTLLATNSVKRGAFGLDAGGIPLVDTVPAGQDWLLAQDAHGGGPIVALGGTALNGAADWAAEGFTDAAFLGKNPRTFAGYDAAGDVIFGTVDGRRANAKGMSLDELAEYTVSQEIGATHAVNLDGGGSTTMWVKGATYNGVVNYPSDDATQEQMTHPGSRAVSGGFFVLAPPYNHAPRFQTEPPTSAPVEVPYTYDADAIDLNVDDTITFSLEVAPPGMTVDPVTGVIEYTPPADAPIDVDVVLVATDDKGASSAQAFTLVTDGSSGQGGAGGAGGAGVGGFAGGDVGEEGGFGGGIGLGGEGGFLEDEPSGPRRCSCRVPGEDTGSVWASLGLALGVGALRRRRGRRKA